MSVLTELEKLLSVKPLTKLLFGQFLRTRKIDSLNFLTFPHTEMSNPYTSPLINEIHNLFPAILYDHEQFQNVPQLMHYVQVQMRRNFNIFSHNRNQYLDSIPLVQGPSRRRRVNPPERVVSTYEAPEEPTSQDIADFIVNTILRAPIVYTIPGWGGTEGSFLEPVTVTPSIDELQRNTTVTTLIVDTDTNCSVCQDPMDTDATVRKINYCGHTFHRACIDVWFQRNVHCPTCRHDVRVPTESNSIPSNANTT